MPYDAPTPLSKGGFDGVHRRTRRSAQPREAEIGIVLAVGEEGEDLLGGALGVGH
jgi:hypothetical protein